MAVMKDYKCAKHGFFEGRSAKCPMKDCQEEVMVVFLQAPHHVSPRTKLGDKALEGLAKDFKMGDIKSAGIGENQGNLMSRNNKFTKKQYAEAEAHLLRKTSNGEVPPQMASKGLLKAQAIYCKPVSCEITSFDLRTRSADSCKLNLPQAL